LICNRDTGLSGSPFPLPLAISDGRFGVYRRLPSPTPLAQNGFILSYASSLYRVLPSFGLPKARKLPAPSLGFAVPLRDICHPRSCFEHPSARRLSVLGVSHALDGFHRVWLCGFISPHCHVQGSLFRGLCLVRSRIAFRRPSCPLDVVPTLLTGSCPPVSTPSVLALRALLRVRVRCPTAGG